MGSQVIENIRCGMSVTIVLSGREHTPLVRPADTLTDFPGTKGAMMGYLEEAKLPPALAGKSTLELSLNEKDMKPA
jgi:hypothetical protein